MRTPHALCSMLFCYNTLTGLTPTYSFVDAVYGTWSRNVSRQNLRGKSEGIGARGQKLAWGSMHCAMDALANWDTYALHFGPGMVSER